MQLSLIDHSIADLASALRKKLWAKTLLRLWIKMYGCAFVGIFLSYLLAKKKKIEGKTVLVTGAAGGLGKALACEFAKRKASRVVLWDIDANLLSSTKEAMEKTYKGVEVIAMVVDISKRETIYQKADELLAQVGGFVDIVINNAGIVGGKPILEQNDARIQMLMDVNSMALFWMTKKFLPPMLERNEGHMVTVASLAGYLASPLNVDYSASKFAARGFTDALRMELQKLNRTGVKTLCVCPGVMKTDLFKGFKAPLMEAMTPEAVAVKVADSVKSQTEYLLPAFWVSWMGIVNQALYPTWLFDIFNRPAMNAMAGLDHTKANNIFTMMQANRDVKKGA